MTRRADLNEQAVVDGYLAGRSIRDLAADHGVSVRPIHRVLIEREIKRRPSGQRGPDRAPRRARAGARGLSERSRPFSEDELARMAARFRAGEKQAAIADSYECSATTIGRALRLAGVPAARNGQQRDRHHAWKGGRITQGDGYVMVRPELDDEIGQAMKGPRRKYVLEHRLVMAHALERPLTSGEQVHHKNGDRKDNRLANLQLRSGPHGAGGVFRCRSCGSHDVEAIRLSN